MGEEVTYQLLLSTLDIKHVKTSDLNPSVMCTSKSKKNDKRLVFIKLPGKKIILECTKELPLRPCGCPLFIPKNAVRSSFWSLYLFSEMKTYLF
jgi:hypothetical protein